MVLVSGWPFIGCKNRVKQNDTLKIFYLGLGSWQCVSSTNHHSKLSFWWLDASWLMVVGWWWLSVAVIVLSDHTSSLINLNFSVTKNEFTWIINASGGGCHRTYQSSFWRRWWEKNGSSAKRLPVIFSGWFFSKLCKFLSNSESHDFICHNRIILDLTTNHHDNRGNIVDNWTMTKVCFLVVEIVNYKVSVTFLTARRPVGPQCWHVIIISTNDGPMPPTRFFYFLLMPPFFNAADSLHIGTLAGWEFHRRHWHFCPCPSVRHRCWRVGQVSTQYHASITNPW